MRRPIVITLALCALAAGAPRSAPAQGLFGKLKSKVGSAVDQKSNEVVDKALNAIVCAVTDANCIRKAKAEGKPIKVTDANGKPVSSADSAAAISAAVASAAAAAGPLDSTAGSPTAPSASPAAAGKVNLFDAISTKGRVATHGVLFDSGSDRIREESVPTLQEIGDMLTAHPELKLEIDGYTDNVGSAAANRTLSAKRAAAVKQYLVAKFGIAAARLTSRGFGPANPIASNDTPDGRDANRRLELVRK